MQLMPSRDRLQSVFRVVSVALMAVGFWGTVSLIHVVRRLATEPRPRTRCFSQMRRLPPPPPPRRLAPPRLDDNGRLMPLRPARASMPQPLGLWYDPDHRGRTEWRAW
jgi:hypothetical protein